MDKHSLIEGRLAAGARKRRKAFASPEEAHAVLTSKPPFQEFSPATVQAYITHDMITHEGACCALVVAQYVGASNTDEPVCKSCFM